MQILNLEIKAQTSDLEIIEGILKRLDADYKGLDRQIDTYYKVDNGRLKMREGNIEKSLIRYYRNEQKDIKRSEVLLYKPVQDTQALKEILDSLFDRLCIVDKRRKIFFINNVKFHLDHVEELGRFVEIEAIDTDGTMADAQLRDQCEYYIDLFGIERDHMIDRSYSDMILEKRKRNR